MKNIKLIWLILLLTSISFSCKEDFLDRPVSGMMEAENVFSSEAAVEAYFVTLYNRLPIEDFQFVDASPWRSANFDVYPGHGHGFLADFCDEARHNHAYDGNAWSNPSWSRMFTGIREVNEFIVNIDEADISDEKRSQYLGHAKFIRAFHYYELAKMFGGVPLVLEPQQANENLTVPRNKEVEIWDQVKKDLDAAIAGMPETSKYGKANKYAAAALKSRAMLYAGSIAKYGEVRANGLVGIPASRAQDFFTASYNASQMIMESGNYSLFKKYWAADDQDAQAKNFQYLFLETRNNPEVILTKPYIYPEKTHSWDCFALPAVHAPKFGSRLSPTVDLVEEFDRVDGSDGTLNFKDENGDYIHYDSPHDPFQNKDPRFEATVLRPFEEFKETTVELQTGVIYEDEQGELVKLRSGELSAYFDPETKSITSENTGIMATGNSGGYENIGGRNNRVMTGFFLQKYVDPERSKAESDLWQSRTDWIAFRYGEVLLNHAEATYELDNKDNSEALDAINDLRERAGIAQYNSINMDKIRQERMVELAFENKRFWDLRRWRTLTQFSQWRATSMRLYLYYNPNGDNTYVFERDSLAGGALTYEEKHYYERIPAAKMDKNPELEQNPFY